MLTPMSQPVQPRMSQPIHEMITIMNILLLHVHLSNIYLLR